MLYGPIKIPALSSEVSDSVIVELYREVKTFLSARGSSSKLGAVRYDQGYNLRKYMI